jgi:transcriptional regulator with XRE-family HTH domain
MNAMLSDSESLRVRMEAVGISSFRALAQHSGVSRRQVDWLRRGKAQALSVQDALQLAATLKLSLAELLYLFGDTLPVPVNFGADETLKVAPYSQERVLLADPLQSSLEQENMKLCLLETFQAEVLDILESLILQWPTVAHIAQQNPSFSAVKLIPLLKPLAQLLQAWEIEAIAAVGAVVDYDPTLHQWMGDSTPPALGCSVQVSHVGYRQRERLLHRAKVRAPKFEVVSST